MKTRLFLTTVFAIMLFAVAGNAQANLVRFNSHSSGSPLSTSRSGGMMLDALHGKPIKVVIHLAKSDKSTPKLLEAVVKGKTFKAIPCGPGERVNALSDSGKVEAYVEIQLQNTLVSNYSISGHAGSCGLLSIRLWNGTEYFGKIRFVSAR